MLPWSRSPPESSHPFGGPAQAPGPAPTRFRAPSTTSPGLAPERRGRPPPPRSALGLSQPLSGLPAHPGFAALSHAAAVPGVLPSERSSSLGSRAPLGAALLPCGSPSQYLRCDARGLVLRVSPHSPRLRLARLGSPRSSDTVSGGLAPVFPDVLDPAHRDHPVPAPSSASKPSSPRESALPTAGCPATESRCSPGLPPLQSLRPT